MLARLGGIGVLDRAKLPSANAAGLGRPSPGTVREGCDMQDNGTRLRSTIRLSASLVAAMSAAGAAWAYSHGGIGSAVPFLLILAVTAIAGWNAAAMAGRTFRNLRTAEGRLEAAAEALPDGLVVFDRDDRIVFYNSRYPEMMTEALRDGLALGKRFEDWMREGIERGPVYHPDMGPDFLAHRLAMREGRHSEHAMRIADGRWMRVRDNMMEDGSRVLLITDITEERRRAAELRLLALAVEQAGDPVEITGADHGFTYVNHAFETTTGYSATEALGLQPQEILSSGLQPPEFFADMRRELEAGRTWHGTIINRHRDGHLIEQETTIAPLREENGAMTHFVAVKRDVTESRAQARALAASEARYRAVVDAQTEFIVRVGPDGFWTFMNEAAERNIGMTLEEMRDRGLSEVDLILPDDRHVYDAHLARITPENPTSTVEWRALHPDGKVHWEHWTGTGIFDAGGRLVEIQCIGREITDRKLAEQAREEAERLRLAALEAALDCYIAADERGQIIEFNAAAERTFGYSRAEAIGQPMVELVVPPEARETGAAHSRAGGLATWAADFLDRRVEVEAKHADGTDFPIELVIVQGERGGSPIFLAYMRDLTDRRASERALAEREEQFRTIAESVPIGLVISDIETGRPLYINPQSRLNLEVGPDDEPELADARMGESRAARRPCERGDRDWFGPRSRGGLLPAERPADEGVDLGHAHPLLRPRGDAGRDRRHHRAPPDRGGAGGKPQSIPCLHGFRAAGRASARRRRAVPDVQPPHGGADRRASRGGLGKDPRGNPSRRSRQRRRAPPFGGEDRQAACQ